MPDSSADLVEGMRLLYRRFNEEGTEPSGGSPVDYKALYSARLVRQRSIGGDLQGIDVQFDDPRIVAPQPIPYSPFCPASLPKLKAGTRLLIGWIGGDESQPYVAGTWLGNGGLDSLSITSGWTAPAVGGDTVTEHDAGGGAKPTIDIIDIADISSATLKGRDRLMEIKFVVDNNINSGTPLLTVIMAREYTDPISILSKDSAAVSITWGGGAYFVLTATDTINVGERVVRVQVGEADPPA